MKNITNVCFMLLVLITLSNSAASLNLKKTLQMPECTENQCANRYGCEKLSPFNLSTTSDGTGLCLRECYRGECYNQDFVCIASDSKNILTEGGKCSNQCGEGECIDENIFMCVSLKYAISDRSDGTGFCLKSCSDKQCIDENSVCRDLNESLTVDREGKCIDNAIKGDFIGGEIIGGDTIYPRSDLLISPYAPNDNYTTLSKPTETEPEKERAPPAEC